MIDAYVDALARCLRGPRAVRLGMLAEVRDGLTDAALAYESTGLPAVAARTRAVDDFGPVDRIAAELQAELRARQARRTAVVLAVAVLAEWLGAELHWRMAYAAADATAQPSAAYSYFAGIADFSHVVVVAVVLAAFVLIGRAGVDRGAARSVRAERLVRRLGGFGLGVIGTSLFGGVLLTAFAPFHVEPDAPIGLVGILGGVLMVLAIGAGVFTAVRCQLVARHVPPSVLRADRVS